MALHQKWTKVHLIQKAHLGPLKIARVKVGYKPPSSFREKLQKCKSELKSNFGLWFCTKKWAKVQLSQKAHEGLPKITSVVI